MAKDWRKIHDSIYIHKSALREIPASLEALVTGCIERYGVKRNSWNIIKFFTRDFKISFLNYPEFENDSYPQLEMSQIVDLENKLIKSGDYSKSDNPPILR